MTGRLSLPAFLDTTLASIESMRSKMKLLTLAGVTVLSALACDEARDTAGAEKPALDRPLASYRAELLDLAFRTASSLPANPHQKTRSRLQEEVVGAWLRLQQPVRAADLARQIEDWRRGTAFADIALHHAQAGARAEARRHLDLAAQVADRREVVDDLQEWRRDRIRVGIARVYTLLQEHDLASRFATGLVDHEQGKLDSIKARVAAPEGLDEQIAGLEVVLAKGSLDQQRNALAACLEILQRCYGDPARRTRVVQLVKSVRAVLPAAVAFETLAGMAGIASAHGDRESAAALATEAGQVIAGATWLPEDQIQLQARLAVVRHRTGDAAGAARELEAALACFAAARPRIADVFRARALRAVAEAWHATGDTTAALAAYRMAVAEGTANPNSRPRAEDLCATCCSMATQGVEPDAELRTRMAQIHERLGAPW